MAVARPPRPRRHRPAPDAVALPSPDRAGAGDGNVDDRIPLVSAGQVAGSEPVRTGGWPRAASWMVTAMVAVALVVGLVLRAWLVFHEPVTSDEAVAGLMARQILHGHTTAFFWGQTAGGVEPYVVAGVFVVLGQTCLALVVTPVLLSALAAVLVWRIARRLVEDRRLAVLAGALAWAAPFPVVFTTTIEGGYRGVTLVCGLGVLLLCLRVLDGKRGYREFVALGLVAGVGWWSLPEMAYFALPAALLLVGAVATARTRGRDAVDPGGWLLRAGVTLACFVSGALPWWWANAGSGFASLDPGSFPGAEGPLNPGYLGRLRVFFAYSVPAYLDLRRLVSGAWLFGNRGASAPERALFVSLSVLLIGAVVVAVVLCFRRGGRWAALGCGVVAFPLLVAAQPATWVWLDGRYVVYLGPLLALVVVVGAEDLARRARAGRRGRREGAEARPDGGARSRIGGRLLVCGVVAVAVFLTIVDFGQVTGARPARATSGWGNPDGGSTATAAALESRGIRFGYADYWVAYKLDFVSGGRLSLAPAGSDPDRWPSLTAAVRSSSSPAWLFVPPARFPEGFVQFSRTVRIQGPSSLPEAQFLAGLRELDVPYRTVNVGPLQAVLPARPVEQHDDGSIGLVP